jgi:hypothetical protein
VDDEAKAIKCPRIYEEMVNGRYDSGESNFTFFIRPKKE